MVRTVTLTGQEQTNKGETMPSKRWSRIDAEGRLTSAQIVAKALEAMCVSEEDAAKWTDTTCDAMGDSVAQNACLCCDAGFDSESVDDLFFFLSDMIGGDIDQGEIDACRSLLERTMLKVDHIIKVVDRARAIISTPPKVIDLNKDERTSIDEQIALHAPNFES